MANGFREATGLFIKTMPTWIKISTAMLLSVLIATFTLGRQAERWLICLNNVPKLEERICEVEKMKPQIDTIATNVDVLLKIHLGEPVPASITRRMRTQRPEQ